VGHYELGPNIREAILVRRMKDSGAMPATGEGVILPGNVEKTTFGWAAPIMLF
jgi:hypothetical protein